MRSYLSIIEDQANSACARGWHVPLLFAYNADMPSSSLPSVSSQAIRRDLSERNLHRAGRYEHESTYGAVPSVIYREANGTHGNFLQASYRSICADPEWRKRLE